MFSYLPNIDEQILFIVYKTKENLYFEFYKASIKVNDRPRGTSINNIWFYFGLINNL